MSRTACLVILVCLVNSAAIAGVTLELLDGQELKGRSVKQKDGFYLLTLDESNVLPVPEELVSKVTPDERPAPTGLRLAEAETLVGPPDGPKLPRYAEQVEVLRGSASTFRRSIIDPYWQPTSDWDNDPKANNFHPVHWYQPPIDPNWIPTSGLGEDVTNFNPARWYRAPIDSTWWPEDGFAWRKQ